MPIFTAFARCIFHVLPLPGRVLRPLLHKLNPRCPSHPVITRISNGLRMEIRDFGEYIQRNIYFFGRYEVRETRLVKRLLRPGDIFLDVGANIGWFTLLAARAVGVQGRVFAFEPSSAIRRHLADHIRLNSLGNVTLDGRALSDAPGAETLSFPSRENAGTGSIVGSGGGEMVTTVPFDEVFPALGVDRVRLAKVDVEGAEFKVLRGMDRSLREHRIEHILIEVNDAKLRALGDSAAALCAWLRDRAYTLHRIRLSGPVPLGGEALRAEENLLASVNGS